MGHRDADFLTTTHLTNFPHLTCSPQVDICVHLCVIPQWASARSYGEVLCAPFHTGWDGCSGVDCLCTTPSPIHPSQNHPRNRRQNSTQNTGEKNETGKTKQKERHTYAHIHQVT
uniref:Uncharacterized protein n=1 Tax=Trypanosoma vivax (strain Y486) TaxID=1055687 RepID=G0U033_TRYVY|nr:hypothetical protein, unlikely [Trypanosoma vivax Y486]